MAGSSNWGSLSSIYSFESSLQKICFQKRKAKLQKVKLEQKTKSGFWVTVLKVEIADIAFAVDSLLAAIVLALTLTPPGLFTIGDLDGGQFFVILTGGLIGVIIMRFAATYFVRTLHRRPGLETAAFLIVGWVGIKLVVYTLSHPDVAILPYHFPETTLWKFTFWSVLVFIALLGWFLSTPSTVSSEDKNTENPLI